MKIITDSVAYVQKVDLDFIRYRLRCLPQSIALKTYENNELDMDDYNKYDFFKFEDPEDIKYFRNIEYIVDYGPLRNVAYTDITPIGRALAKKKEEVAKKLYSMIYDNEEYSDTLLQYTLLDYQLSSLNDISDFKMGLLKMSIPGEENVFKKLMKLILPKKK